MSAALIDVGPTRDHSTYIGGSDVAAVLGCNPYESPLDVWARKTGRLTKIATLQMRLGSAFERPVCEAYSADYRVTLAYPGTLSDPRVAHRAATPDAIENGMLDVQVKLVGETARDWGDPVYGAESVPEYVVLQVQYEMHHLREVLGVAAPAARVLQVHGTQLQRYTVPRDDELIGAMLEAVDRFWRDHIVADRMPRVSATDDEILRRLHPRAVAPLAPITRRAVELALEHERINGEVREREREKAVIDNELRALIGDGSGFEGDGIKVTWLEQGGRVSWKELAAELGVSPEMVERFRGDGTRVLRVKVRD